MAEEASNPFDAVRKANRAVWEQARGRKPSDESSNLFDAVRKANRAVWEQASGRKPSDESRAIPPPTGRESPLEGADASAMVVALSAKLSALQARVDYIEDDFPEWPVMQGEGDGGGSEYASYFKVIDASEWSTATPPALIACKIGVTNGSAEIADPPVSWCGSCKVSGVRANSLLTGDLENKVPAVPNSGAGSISACSGEIAAEGEYYVWLHSWIAHDGVWCEARIGDVDDNNPPDNPNGGIGWASQLLGRVTVEDVGGDLTVTNITQDYLRGGEHAEDVVGDCAGLELQEPTP